MSSRRGDSLILNISKKFSRKDYCKKSTPKPPNYYGRREKLKD